MVLATLFLREPITWLKAGGVFLGCAGALILILVSQHGTGHSSSVMGDVLCIVSAVSYATYLTAFRNVIVRYSPVTTMKWMFLFAAIVAVVIYYRPLTAVDYAGLAPRTWAGIGYVVVCSTFLSYLMVPSASTTCGPRSCRCTTTCSPSWRCCSPWRSDSTPSDSPRPEPRCASSRGYGW